MVGTPMKLALAIASMVVLVVHGIVFYAQFFHKWERHQTAYFDQARTRARNEAERAELASRAPKIEQILVTSFGDRRVDRCTTCHLAADDPRFKDHFQPLKTHPYSVAMGDVLRNGRWERRHKFNDFGCTVCHDGQGRGLDDEYAHGKDEYWPEPLLGFVTQANWRKDFTANLKGIEYMEAACAQCHSEENFAGTPHVNRGRQLFFKTNCYGCHKIEGLSEGTLAPELTEVGKKFKVDYLWESVVDPRANLATSFMPKFNLKDDEVRDLVIFLKSRHGVNLNETGLAKYRARLAAAKGEAPVEIKPAVNRTADLASQGRELVKDRACAACHKILEEDGGIAPDLSFEGNMKDEPWLMEHFRNPKSRIPDSIMPAFRFSEVDFQSISAYLLTLKNKPAVLTGEETYKTYCARCHGDKGDGKGKTAYYLDPAPRDLTKASFFNSKPLERYIGSIKEGVAGTSMPSWGKVMGEAQIKDTFEYIQATFIKDKRRDLKPRNLPETNPVVSSKDSIARGETTFVARCAGCHGKKADGKGPNSLDIIPHPRNLRNRWFVTSVPDRRFLESILYGVQGTAMPPWIDYGLTQKDAGDLLNFIRSLNTVPAKGQMTARVN